MIPEFCNRTDWRAYVLSVVAELGKVVGHRVEISQIRTLDPDNGAMVLSVETSIGVAINAHIRHAETELSPEFLEQKRAEMRANKRTTRKVGVRVVRKHV